MENNNVVIVKHHPRPITLTNSFYTTQCPDLADRVVIDLTSRNPDRNFSHQVSPFFVGPVTGPDGASADSLEVFWQVGKVFPHHDLDGQPNSDYFNYRNEMYGKKQGEISKPIMRHPYHEFGYEADDMLYWAFWNSEKGEYERLSYLEARKKVYVPEYAKLVANSDALKWMRSLLEQGKKIALLDFDGFNYYCEEAMKIRYRAYVLKCKKEKRPILKSEKDFTDIKDMKSAVGFAYTPVGHAFVVKALLQGDIEVVDDKVIDHIGMIA
jgi:hypothetical protein